MAKVATKKNFLASEEGFISKTAGADAVTNAASLVVETDAEGFSHHVLKAGSLFYSANVKGIVLDDVDLSGTTATTQKEVPVMVSGYYIASKLPTPPANAGSGGSPAATKPSLDECKAQNLIAVTWEDGKVTRPAETPAINL